MLAKVLSCAVIGLDGELVDVEIDISRGEPKLTVVGLPDAAIQESKDRVRSAIRNSALTWPFNSRIVVNLAPAGFAERKSRGVTAAAARTRRGV